MLAADTARQVGAQVDDVADDLERNIDAAAEQVEGAIDAAGERLEGAIDDAPRQTAAVLQQVTLCHYVLSPLVLLDFPAALFLVGGS